MKLGLPASFSATDAANPTTTRSTAVFRLTEIAPRNRNCRVMCPLAGKTNWGRNERKKSAVFGFRNLGRDALQEVSLKPISLNLRSHFRTTISNHRDSPDRS